MAGRFGGRLYSNAPAVMDTSIDAGLRSYMLSVYNYMASGVLLTGIVALYVSTNENLMNVIFGTGLSWVVILAPFAFILAINFGINKMRASTLQTLFWAFAAVMGISLSTIFITYTGTSVAKVFFISAGSFAGLSLYGYTTKKDLSPFRTFLVMGLIGLIIAMIANIFIQSSGFDFIISIFGVLIFAGLTAYDTQMIKSMYYEADGLEAQSKKIIMGAVRLYLDFINLFLMLLRLLGNRN